VNLSQLASAIAERFRLPEAEARKLLDFEFQEIAGALKAGKRVYFRGFGSFAKRIRPGRWFKNPRTGEREWIPARPYVDFRAAPAVVRGLAPARQRLSQRRQGRSASGLDRARGRRR
jgi:nucleoid DNA-binding protein